MTPDRWQQIKQTVKKQFSLEEQGVEDLLVNTAEGQVKQGKAEFVIFSARGARLPVGQGSAFGGEKLKLQFQKKPRLEEKKYHFSHRQGDSAQVEYKFSETEMVYNLKAYKWDETQEEWKEINASNFG